MWISAELRLDFHVWPVFVLLLLFSASSVSGTFISSSLKVMQLTAIILNMFDWTIKLQRKSDNKALSPRAPYTSSK